MLDHYVDNREAGGMSRAHIWLALSAVGHAAVVVILVVSALWRIEKVSYEPNGSPLQLGASIGSPPPPAGTAAPDKPKTETERKIVDDGQATTRVREGATDTGAGDRVGIADGDPNGVKGGTGDDPDGIPGGTGTGSVVGNIGCGAGKILCNDAPPPPPEETPRAVPANLIDGKRFRGTTQIQPPDSARDQMSDDRVRSVRAVVKLCLSKSGRVSSVKLLESTGYDAYDRKLLAAVRQWRYHPYKLDSGDAVPVCTSVVFNYAQR